MPGTTTFDRGAVVLVKFVFANEKGAKKRPALVLSTRRYHAGRREVVVAAITSRLDRSLVGDHRIAASGPSLHNLRVRDLTLWLHRQRLASTAYPNIWLWRCTRRQAGLPLPSVVTGILRTVKRDMIEAVLGAFEASDLLAVECNLRESLGL